MLDINTILSLKSIKFDNTKWQQTIFTDLSTFVKSSSYNSFYIASINRSIIQNNTEGLFYILQRLCFYFEEWETNNAFELSKQQFVDYVLYEGYLAQRKGILVNIKDFKKEIKSINVMPELIQLKNTLEVYCFSNHWHTHQYTIITHKEIIFMEWGVS